MLTEIETSDIQVDAIHYSSAEYEAVAPLGDEITIPSGCVDCETCCPGSCTGCTQCNSCNMAF